MTALRFQRGERHRHPQPPLQYGTLDSRAINYPQILEGPPVDAQYETVQTSISNEPFLNLNMFIRTEYGSSL